jgi:hypothetical protein
MADLYNPEQLSTYADARELRDWLNQQPQFARCRILSGDDEAGVKKVVNPNMPWLPPRDEVPGIYVPRWEGGPGGFAVPHIGDATFLHYRMANGFSGANVGLIRTKFLRYPTAQQYVLDVLAKEYGGL